MCWVSPYPTQSLFALPLYHWMPLQTLPTVDGLLPPHSVLGAVLIYKTLLSDCPLTLASGKYNAYAFGAWRVHVGVSTRTC